MSEFKITKTGFYKARDGEKWEVVYIANAGIYPVIAKKVQGFERQPIMDTFTLDGYADRLRNGGVVESPEDLIAEWKEPRKVMVPDIYVYFVKYEDGVVLSGDKLIEDKDWQLIETIPAHEIEIED